mgnify:CR=1 FL=1
MSEEKYLILSENDMVLCEAVLEKSSADTVVMKVKDSVKSLKDLEIVKFHKMQSYAETYQGHILDISGLTVTINKVVNVSAQMRSELKVKIRFETQKKKITMLGEVENQTSVPVVSRDISCGGICFLTKTDLDTESTYEIVIPITSEPILADLKIVRKEFIPEENMFIYGSKFIDFNVNGERMLREAVFKLQMRYRKSMEEKK